MSFEGIERRKHPRQPVAVQVKYRSLDTFFYDYALNISRGGIFIKTENPLARGSELDLEFEAPGFSTGFKTTGVVVRVVLPGKQQVEPAGMGIEFAPLDKEDEARIDALWRTSATIEEEREG